MVEEIVMNMTSGLSSVGSTASIGWMITIVIFIGIFLTLFLIFRNFRRTIYGAIVTGISYGVYELSRWTGITYAEGNQTPFNTVAYIIIFIIISWIVGRFVERMKWVKKFEKTMGEGEAHYENKKTKKD